MTIITDTDDITTHSCTLLWTPPSDLGGTAIVRYVIEQRETGRHTWTKLGSVKADKTKFEVTKLIKGKEYEFQVSFSKRLKSNILVLPSSFLIFALFASSA